MDCKTFEHHLPDFQKQRLEGDVRLEAEAHLQDCPECRLLSILPSGFMQSSPDLTLDILARTTGSACPRLQEQACAFVDGELDEDRSALVRGHLDHCEACSVLVASLVELKAVLPKLACLNPGPAFLQDLLRRTVRLDPWMDFRAFWRRVLSRPRICLEAAYAGTLAGVLVLNVPIPKLQADKGVIRLTGTLRTKQLLPPILGSARKLVTTVLVYEQHGARKVQESLQRGGTELAAGLRHQGRNLDELQERTSKDLRSWFHQLGKKSNPEESTEPGKGSSRSSS